MRKTALTLLAIVFAITGTMGQAPQSINYQGVARDNTGAILVTQPIGLRISIHQTTPTGTVVYQETHSDTTNQFGLFNIAMGGGSVVSGTFSAIAWGSDDHFVEVEMDETGGTNYQTMGTSQLLSVPYALYSETTGDTTMWKKNGTNVYYDAGLVGIGTAAPSYHMHILKQQDAATRLLIENGDVGASAQSSLALTTNGGTGYLYRTSIADPLFGDALVMQDNGGGPLIFYSGSEHMRITSGGNVGINTTGPGNLFTIRPGGTVNSDMPTVDMAAGNAYGAWRIDSVGSEKARYAWNISLGTYVFDASGVGTSFMRSNLSTSMFIKDDGNIGIGTTAPASKLQVNSGDVYVDTIGSGVILTSPNGNCWRVTINNAGTLITTTIACP